MLGPVNGQIRRQKGVNIIVWVPPLCYQLCYTCGRVQALLFCVTIYFFNRFSFSKVRASFLARFKEVNLEFNEPKAMETETIDVEVFIFFFYETQKTAAKRCCTQTCFRGDTLS